MTDPHKLYTNKHYDDKVEEIMTNSELKAEVERLKGEVKERPGDAYLEALQAMNEAKTLLLQSELTAYKEMCEKLVEALSDAYDVLGYGRCRDAIVGRAITEYEKFKRERE